MKLTCYKQIVEVLLLHYILKWYYISIMIASNDEVSITY